MVEPRPYTPEEIAAALPTGEEIRLASEAEVRRQVEHMRSMMVPKRGTKHRPGATKAVVKKRAAQNRKRKTAARSSRKKNRN